MAHLNRTTPWTWPALVVAATMFLALPALAQAPATQRFGNAEVACDPDLNCVAFLTAKDADGETASVLQFRRSPERRSRWSIAISTVQNLADRNRPISLAADGGIAITLRPESDYAPFVTVRDFFILSQFALDRLMVDLQASETMRLSYIDISGAPHTDRFQLDGLRQALLEVDRRQKFVVGDRRAGPPEDLPPAPEVDKQAMVAMQGVPPSVIEMHLGSDCEEPDTPAFSGIEPIVGILSDTAMLYALPCFRAKERVNWRLYRVESGEIGGVDLLVWATWSSRFGWMGTETLEDVAWNEDSRTLSATKLGEAAGCGTTGSWTWDQFAFKLVSFRAHESCNAPRDPASWPEIYPGPGSQ
ncbi:DUF1176 domain-containing protein [Chthonobacter albigriseus]|uniref:DUF1176 domain-containing protein n=1 Tax=Chthonobacter albigriseus TaxID=1683161 RepID=UPI0015EED7C6|nr:DUF1176 domain-containing protein [Chthonobacter albigriseus]